MPMLAPPPRRMACSWPMSPIRGGSQGSLGIASGEPGLVHRLIRLVMDFTPMLAFPGHSRARAQEAHPGYI